MDITQYSQCISLPQSTDPSASLHYQLLSYRLNNQTSSSLIKRFELFEIQQKVKSPIRLCTEVCESINPRTLTVSRSSLINDYLQPYCMSFDPYNEFLLAGGSGKSGGYISVFNYNRFLQTHDRFYYKEGVKKYPRLAPITKNHNPLILKTSGTVRALRWTNESTFAFIDIFSKSLSYFDLNEQKLSNTITLSTPLDQFFDIKNNGNTVLLSDKNGSFYWFEKRDSNYKRKWSFSNANHSISCYCSLSDTIFAISYSSVPVIYFYDSSYLTYFHRVKPFSMTRTPALLASINLSELLSDYLQQVPPSDLTIIDIQPYQDTDLLLVSLRCGWNFLLNIYTNQILLLYTYCQREQFSGPTRYQDTYKWWLEQPNEYASSHGTFYNDHIYIAPSQSNRLRFFDLQSSTQYKDFYSNNHRLFEEQLNRKTPVFTPFYIDVPIDKPYTALCVHEPTSSVVYSMGSKEEATINVLI